MNDDMKCIVCGKKINTTDIITTIPLGVSMETIHLSCVDNVDKLVDKLNSMDDKSFESMLLGKLGI